MIQITEKLVRSLTVNVLHSDSHILLAYEIWPMMAPFSFHLFYISHNFTTFLLDSISANVPVSLFFLPACWKFISPCIFHSVSLPIHIPLSLSLPFYSILASPPSPCLPNTPEDTLQPLYIKQSWKKITSQFLLNIKIDRWGGRWGGMRETERGHSALIWEKSGVISHRSRSPINL